MQFADISLAVILNGFRISMPREATVPFTGKISIYSGTQRTGTDVAMHSRRVEKKK